MRKNILISALLLAGSLSAAAQEPAVEYENVFAPHWYVGIQGGAQYTLGETGFSDLISPNAQIMVGYKFHPVLGVRLGINAWQSKAGLKGNYSDTSFERNWKYKYVAPNVDLTVDLSNLVCGFNPNRVFNLGMFVGVGANVAFSNDEANDISTELASTYPNWKGTDGQNLSNLWDGTKVRLQGRAGITADFRVSEKLSLGLEVNANVLNDKYNSKKAGNADWYFNGLVGLKYSLGDTYTKKEVKKAAPQVVERVVEKIVEKPVQVEKVVKADADPLRLDIFFTVSSTNIVQSESLKVKEIANYLSKHPDSKVEITGYADKGTGSAEGNMRLSEKRAKIVVDALKKLGVSEDRIKSTTYKGDKEQPFDINELNRVSICVVK